MITKYTYVNIYIYITFNACVVGSYSFADQSSAASGTKTDHTGSSYIAFHVISLFLDSLGCVLQYVRQDKYTGVWYNIPYPVLLGIKSIYICLFGLLEIKRGKSFPHASNYTETQHCS